MSASDTVSVKLPPCPFCSLPDGPEFQLEVSVTCDRVRLHCPRCGNVGTLILQKTDRRETARGVTELIVPVIEWDRKLQA